MSGFTLEIKGLDKLQKVFKQIPRTIQSEIKHEFQAIGQEWQNKAKADAPVDTSRLKSSVNNKVDDLSLEMVAQSKHAAHQEFGTKGQFKAPSILGNYPNQFRGGSSGEGNPIDALTKWVERKGIVPRGKGKSRSVAFLIYRKIKREGIKPQPFLFTGKDGSNRIEYFYNKVKKNIATILKEVVNG